jgi:hypothetical protein
MERYKTLRIALWASLLLDALIVISIVLKASRVGIGGLFAWFRHLHLVATSVLNGQATYQLEPDYRFTILYTAVIVGAFTLSFVLVRSYRVRRNRAQHPGGGYHSFVP